MHGCDKKGNKKTFLEKLCPALTNDRFKQKPELLGNACNKNTVT